MEDSIDEVRKSFLQKITGNKYGKWAINAIVIYSIANTAVEKITPLYKYLAPKISYALGIEPDADTVLVQRHAFLSGLYVHNIFDNIRNNKIDNWYPYYRDEVGRLFGSLEALGFKVSPEIKALSHEKLPIVERLYIYHDLRNQLEPFLETKGIGVKYLYDASFYLSVASNASDGDSVMQYIKTATESLNQFKKTFPNRLPPLQIMQIKYDKGWDKNAAKAATETIIALKHYFNNKN